MVVDSTRDSRIDLVFGALSDATRRDILERSAHADYSVSALARCYPASFAAIQKHVAVLERAGLIAKEKRGREQIVKPEPAGLEAAKGLLSRLEAVWAARIDRFGQVLTEIQSGQESR